MVFLYSYRESNSSKQTRRNCKRSQRKSMQTNLFYISSGYTYSAKEFKCLSWYEDLQIEVERMRQMKTSIIAIFFGALGSVKKRTSKHVE